MDNFIVDFSEDLIRSIFESFRIKIEIRDNRISSMESSILSFNVSRSYKWQDGNLLLTYYKGDCEAIHIYDNSNDNECLPICNIIMCEGKCKCGWNYSDIRFKDAVIRYVIKYFNEVEYNEKYMELAGRLNTKLYTNGE